MAEFYVVAGDTEPPLELTALDADGAAVDITGLTAVLLIERQSTGFTVEHEAEIPVGTDGKFGLYDRDGTEFPAAGGYTFRGKLTDGASLVLWVPSDPAPFYALVSPAMEPTPEDP